MSKVPNKFLPLVDTPFVPVDVDVVAGDTFQDAFRKLQGQLDNSQEVYVGTAPSAPNHPALLFEAVTISGQTVYRMRVHNGLP